MARLKTIVRRKGWREPKSPTQAEITRHQRDIETKVQIYRAGLLEGARFMREKLLNELEGDYTPLVPEALEGHQVDIAELDKVGVVVTPEIPE